MSTAAPARRLTVDDRERGVLALVRDRGDAGATVREIHEGVSESLGDSVTVQAYYKLLARMEATGRLEAATDADGGERRYRLAPYLHPETALTLDDVYAMLEELEPTDAIARVIDAREYYDERRHDILSRAAAALREEDPRELMARMILDRAAELRTDVEMLRDEQLHDRELEGRVRGQLREFHQIVYRYLGLSRAAVDAPPELAHVRSGQAGAELVVDESRLREELARRVFGETAIELIDVNGVAEVEEWNRSAVAGTDGSTYGTVMQLASASGFTDDVGSQVVTINNAVAFVQGGASAPGPRDDAPYHSVPMSRSAIDDRSNKGMVMAPFMYRYLQESEYEHMAKCATDVVQWRVDAAVFGGTARSMGQGATLSRPRVHFRDGTITPQEREYGHYRRHNEYGEMVREGISLSRQILDRLISSPSPQVFAGAVKTTQARLFASLLNWYIARGSGHLDGGPIDPGWDTTRAAHIADNEAMSMLLSTLNSERGAGQYFVTFQVMRPFHSLTEYYRHSHRDDPAEWVERFRKKQRHEQEQYDAGDTPEQPWLSTVPDVADEPFVVMCTNADYVSFYVGHTAGDPPPTVPRYEFLEALRRMAPADAADRVHRNVRLVVGALERSKFAQDRDHNFLSRKILVKIIPHVVAEAHEKCKALGRQLDTELRSIVIANLQGIRGARSLSSDEIRFLPLSVRRFVERYRAAVDDRGDDSGSGR